jgi:3-oxoacyl-[acyl-carrier-protein] synthase-3
MGTATPDMPVAATGVYVATEKSYERFAFDFAGSLFQFFVWNVCCLSMFNLENIKGFTDRADKMSSIVDYTDRSTCIIFGDGAGAVLFEPNHEGLGVQDEYLRSDGVGRDFLKLMLEDRYIHFFFKTVEENRHNIVQDGKTVFF